MIKKKIMITPKSLLNNPNALFQSSVTVSKRMKDRRLPIQARREQNVGSNPLKAGKDEGLNP